MTITATCHCGATKIELPFAPKTAARCNCSFCARTGAIWGYFSAGELKVLSNEGEKTYSASGGMNLHHFCSSCGIHTWGDSPDWASAYNADGTPKNGDPSTIPTQRTYAINLNLIDDFDWASVEVQEMDGRSNW